tara:strand:+ start:182 stop:904 length:723 start_codon:yes stop_codon:yes gene_type:complete
MRDILFSYKYTIKVKENSMANSKSTQPNSLATEGRNIASFLRKRDRLECGTFNADIENVKVFDPKNPVGVWTRLGFMAHQIAIGNTDKNTCGLRSVDRRRMSEAKWFYENQAEATAFNKASKKGFTNLSALQKAVNASKKRTEKAETTEGKQSDVGQSTKGTSTEGKSTEGKKKVFSNPLEVVQAIKLACKASNIEINDVLELLLEEATASAKETTKGSFEVIGKTIVTDSKTGTDDVPF